MWVAVRKPDAVNPEKNPTDAHSPEIEATLDKLRSQRRVDMRIPTKAATDSNLIAATIPI